ncbi:MAG: polyphosphate polymerase domain-containing protein [Rikenellaceae bacterium]
MGVAHIIDKFEGITLLEMDGVKLMNRTDRKYWFNALHLAELLEDVIGDYYLLDIDGERNQAYSTIYFDTPVDRMYTDHHRGKMNRYKIRRRNYHVTNSSFLEVKFKNNKGRTAKVRCSSDYSNSGFSVKDDEFIKASTPFSSEQLQKVLENRFRRLMLVSKAMNERCTIDTELQFVSNNNEIKLSTLVIVEVKSDGKNYSPIIDALSKRRIKSSGFSKYCMGRSVTDDSLHTNNFKLKHRQIEKKLNIKLSDLILPENK